MQYYSRCNSTRDSTGRVLHLHNEANALLTLSCRSANKVIISVRVGSIEPINAFFLLSFNFEDERPPQHFDAFIQAMLTVFQVFAFSAHSIVCSYFDL